MLKFDAKELQTIADITRGAGEMNDEEYGLVTDAVRKATLVERLDGHLEHTHRDTSGIDPKGMSFTEYREACENAPIIPREELGIDEGTIDYVESLDADGIVYLLGVLQAYRRQEHWYALDFEMMKEHGHLEAEVETPALEDATEKRKRW